MNKFIVSGRLGADPELRYTPSGVAVCKFNICTKKTWFDQKTNQQMERVDWHRVVAWKTQAELIGKSCRKGDRLLLQGEINNNQYVNKDGAQVFGYEVQLDFFEFIEAKRNNSENQDQQQNQSGTQQNSKPQRKSNVRPVAQQYQRSQNQQNRNQNSAPSEDDFYSEPQSEMPLDSSDGNADAPPSDDIPF